MIDWPSPEHPMFIPKWVMDLAEREHRDQNPSFWALVADGSILVIDEYPPVEPEPDLLAERCHAEYLRHLNRII